MIPSCCRSRLGMVKASYESRDAAMKGIRRLRRREEPGKTFEPYECMIHPGRFHIRTIRKPLAG